MLHAAVENKLSERKSKRSILDRHLLPAFGDLALDAIRPREITAYGVPLKAVQELLGHASIEMTMRYAHLVPDVSREAVRLLDAAGRARASGRREAAAGTWTPTSTRPPLTSDGGAPPMHSVERPPGQLRDRWSRGHLP